MVADEGSPELWAYLERGMDAHFAQLALEAERERINKEREAQAEYWRRRGFGV